MPAAKRLKLPLTMNHLTTAVSRNLYNLQADPICDFWHLLNLTLEKLFAWSASCLYNNLAITVGSKTICAIYSSEKFDIVRDGPFYLFLFIYYLFYLFIFLNFFFGGGRVGQFF